MSTLEDGARSKEGWEDHWNQVSLPKTPRLWLPNVWSFHRFFSRNLRDLEGKRVLDVGCVPGIWMIYFARTHGAVPTGIDYAPNACKTTRRNLDLVGIDAECHCGDIRDPDLDIGTFDVVYSMGVVEHYRDLREILDGHARRVVPGGRVCVTIPNLAGVHGLVLRRANRGLYDEHVPHRLGDLLSAGRALGLDPVVARPFGRIIPPLALGWSMPRPAQLGLLFLGALWPVDIEPVSAHLGVVFVKR